MKIDKPGIYPGVSSADYFADPCPTPSLTQSLCKILIETSPQHAWTAHPRLNPQFEYDSDTKFDLGNVAHRLVLGRGKEIEVIEFDDWRSKAAKEARAKARFESRIPVGLPHIHRDDFDGVAVNAFVHPLQDRGLIAILQNVDQRGNAQRHGAAFGLCQVGR